MKIHNRETTFDLVKIVNFKLKDMNLKKMLIGGGKTAFSLLILAALGWSNVQAQTSTVTKNFKVAPLNVDGLPKSILGIELNADGPGADGTVKIGQYIAESGIDVLGLSEDFNYHTNLLEGLGDTYSAGTYRGGLSTSELDYSDIKFNTDGLEFLIKNGNAFTNESWAAWTQTYGKLTNGADELINKGYRYYTVNFGDGILVDFYIMHMDAETDAADNAARASQWTQLANAIKANNNGRPKIVMGDTNSRYTRDDIKGLFFGALEDNYNISDVWVEKCRGELGYPTLGADALMVTKGNAESYKTGEIVDKVIYLNPKNSATSTILTANSITFDTSYTLGDHIPVIVDFTATSNTAYAPAEASSWWRGETRTNATQQMYLFNVGTKYFMSHTDANTNKASITSIAQATLWNLNYSEGGNVFNKYHGTTIAYTDENNQQYRVRLYRLSGLSRETGVYKANGNATVMDVISSESTTGAIKFKNHDDDRYLNISTNDQNEYKAAENKSVDNDWLLISQTQRETYEKYIALYNEANTYFAEDTFEGDDTEDLKSELENALKETQSSNYDKSAEDNKKLEDIIEKCKNRYYNVKVTDVKWASICLPKNTRIPEGLTVYYATKFNKEGRSVHVEPFEGTVMPANTGFLVYSDNADTYKFHITNATTTAPSENIFYGTTTGLDGDFSQNHDVYMLANKSAGVGFYHVQKGVKIAARKAYLLDTTGTTIPSDAKVKISTTDDEPTAIKGMTATDLSADIIAIYDASGAQLQQMKRGLNLVRMSNGTVKKVVVK